MTSRRAFITLLGGAAAAWSVTARAQQAQRIRRIGALMGGSEGNPVTSAWAAAFREGLDKLGWIDGKNIKFDFRWGDNADLQLARAHELARLKLDLILAGAASSLIRLKEATQTIPIVFANVPDPVINGFVARITRPGGNITGFANYELAIGVKWLELLKQIAPRISRAAFMYDPANPATVGYFHAAEGAASSFAVGVTGAPVRSASEIERGIDDFAREPNGGLVVLPGPMTSVHRALIIELAARHRLPVVFPYVQDAKAGGLASYGIDPIDLFRRAASYVDRILKGEKPGELPVQYATKFELAINLKTAKALGLEVPLALLARTDEVIELDGASSSPCSAAQRRRGRWRQGGSQRRCR
jgi:putative ABC transport system substrate-binding protein